GFIPRPAPSCTAGAAAPSTGAFPGRRPAPGAITAVIAGTTAAIAHRGALLQCLRAAPPCRSPAPRAIAAVITRTTAAIAHRGALLQRLRRPPSRVGALPRGR